MDPILKEERRQEKRAKAHYDRIGYVADAHYGIPTSCPCGGMIVDEKDADDKFDTLPGKRFFTCDVYKPDGLHFRQPWVLGVQEEIRSLIKRVEEVERLKWQVFAMKEEINQLKNRLASEESEC